jgi:hypothetical protein
MFTGRFALFEPADLASFIILQTRRAMFLFKHSLKHGSYCEIGGSLCACRREGAPPCPLPREAEIHFVSKRGVLAYSQLRIIIFLTGVQEQGLCRSSTSAADGFNVAVLGAGGGIGQPLSLLLKL